MPTRATDKPPCKLMLDSGAYSALTRGETIDVRKYIDFVKENAELVHSYVNLDVIPGGSTPRALEEAASASYKNLQAMWKANLKPLPVFHIGEDFKWLQRLLDDGERYIGLGGMAKAKQDVRRKWLDKVWTVLSDDQGRPLVKVHGFGLTAVEHLKRYPWYSVDSTAWALAGGYGIVFVPQLKGDKHGNNWFDYTAPYSAVMMAGRERASKTTDGVAAKQYEVMGDMLRSIVDEWLKEGGTNITQMRNTPDLRRRAMLLFFEGLRKQLYDVRFHHRGWTLDMNPIRLPKGLKPLKPHNLTIVYATNLCSRWAVMMNEVGAMHRLLSYYELRDKAEDTIEKFVWLLDQFGKVTEHRPSPNWGEPHRNYRKQRLAARSEATE